MASISSVITGGFGAPGDVYLVITDGYGTSGAVVVPPVIVDTGSAGVRRSRFLRRAKTRLPWEPIEESPDELVSVTEKPTKKQRIKLPKEDIAAVADVMPVVVQTAMPKLQITIPDVGTAIEADDEDDDDFLMML